MPPPPPALAETRAPSPINRSTNAPAAAPMIPPPVSFQSAVNRAGLYKIYPQKPTHDPDVAISLDDLCDSPNLATAKHPSVEPPRIPVPTASSSLFAPFLNASTARLMCWLHNGSNLKSAGELDRLVQDVLLKEDFKASDLRGFSTTREHARIDKDFDQTPVDGDTPDSQVPLGPPGQDLDPDTPPQLRDGWETVTIEIPLPGPKVKCPENKAPVFKVEGVLIRPLLDVMREAFQSEEFLNFHLTPFDQFWDPTHDPSDPTHPTTTPPPCYETSGIPEPPCGHQRTYGELYTSPAMLEAHRALPAHPNLETIIAAYMFWSDSTHLANFGTASLWPLYTFFGNLSKYIRAKPTSHSCHHQAYIPSVCRDHLTPSFFLPEIIPILASGLCK